MSFTKTSIQFLFMLLVIFLFLGFSLNCEAQYIKGKVIDGHLKMPIEGVLVKIEHSSLSTISSKDGYFSLKYVPGEFRIFFTKVGYFPYSFNLKLSQQVDFPTEDIYLYPVPVVMDMYGKPVAGAIVMFKRGFEDPIKGKEPTDSAGKYSIENIDGDFSVNFMKQGFRTDGYQINLKNKKFPEFRNFILCPENFGVYVGDKIIPAGKIVREYKSPPRPSGGGWGVLYIPRVPATWEGQYYFTSKPITISATDSKSAYYIFPAISGRLGPGGDAFESSYSMELISVDDNGVVAKFGEREGIFNRVQCKFEPVVQKVAYYSGGLASQKVFVFKVDVNLTPGKYAFCLFEKTTFSTLFAPSEVAYYFEITDSIKRPGATPDQEQISKSAEQSILNKVCEDKKMLKNIDGSLIQGRWNGSVKQGYQTYPVTMTISQTVIEDQAGKIDYSTLNCGGILTLKEAVADRFVVEEKIEYGRNRCVDGGRIHLKSEGGKLFWEWHYPDGRIGAQAVLEKVP